jgi:formylmethanofuran:tetrahydromethanopterin formyltransferase
MAGAKQTTTIVIPAKAGIQCVTSRRETPQNDASPGVQSEFWLSPE